MEKIRLSTMSRMVSFLEDEDLVRRRDNKSDGRSVLISTTAKGRRLYERAVNQSLEQIVAAIGSLEREQLTAVRQLLSQLGS